MKLRMVVDIKTNKTVDEIFDAIRMNELELPKMEVIKAEVKRLK